MKVNTLLSPLALALVAVLSVSAHASGSYGASASIADVQKNSHNHSTNKTVENTAEVDGSLGGASGNLGVNVAAGDNNQQANAAAIATADSAFVFGFGSSGSAQASVDVYQNNHHNKLTNYGVPNNASLTDSAGGTSGNLGINIAAGNSNQQKNDMAVASSEKAYTAGADVDVYQTSYGNQVNNNDLAGSYSSYKPKTSTPVVNNATVSNSLGGASGNVGVNVAAGSGNQQSNTLAIAAGCTACL